MLTQRVFKWWAVLLFLLISTPGWADMIDTSGMQPWEVCGMCHGLEGYSPVEKFPILAGQREAYMLKQLIDFRQGTRVNDGGQMQTVVEEISESDLHKVAAYFSEQSRQFVGLPPGDRKLWARGRELYQKNWLGELSCGDCHDQSKTKVVEHERVPNLFGQHAAYLAKQLNDFKVGLRVNDDAAPMRSVSSRLSAEDIEALSQYLHIGESRNLQ